MALSRSCVVVGAGMTGLTAARHLKECGWSVVVLDKGRSLGGRMATRIEGAYAFDHGAQFFTVREERFQVAVQQWVSQGWAGPWFSEGGHVRYRGVGGMCALMENVACGLEVRRGTRVTGLEGATTGGGWRLTTSAGEVQEANAVILTQPVPQSLTLLETSGVALSAEDASKLAAIAYDPCIALMVTLNGQSLVPEPGYLRLSTGPVAAISDNGKKGTSREAGAITIHSTPEFARLEAGKPELELVQVLLRAAAPYLGSEAIGVKLHRWSYSLPVVLHSEPCLVIHQPAQLAFAGDAFGGPRVEGAYLSGLEAARRLNEA